MEADRKSSEPVSLATGPCSGDLGSANQTCPCAVWPLDQRGRVRILWEAEALLSGGCGGSVQGQGVLAAGPGAGARHWPFPRMASQADSLCLHRALHHALSQMENQTLPLLLAAGNPDPRRVELALTPRSSSSRGPLKAFRALPATGGPTFLDPGSGAQSTGLGEGGSRVLRDC